jgi:hypothetical protein
VGKGGEFRIQNSKFKMKNKNLNFELIILHFEFSHSPLGKGWVSSGFEEPTLTVP